MSKNAVYFQKFIPYSLNEITRIMNNQPIAKLTLPQDHHEPK